MNQTSPPAWTTWNEAFAVVIHPPFLIRSIRTSLLVGTTLFLINHLDEVISGQAAFSTYLKGGVTCLVPFCVANWGILTATRRTHN